MTFETLCYVTFDLQVKTKRGNEAGLDAMGKHNQGCGPVSLVRHAQWMMPFCFCLCTFDLLSFFVKSKYGGCFYHTLDRVPQKTHQIRWHFESSHQCSHSLPNAAVSCAVAYRAWEAWCEVVVLPCALGILIFIINDIITFLKYSPRFLWPSDHDTIPYCSFTVLIRFRSILTVPLM